MFYWMELIQMPFSSSDYHYLHSKSTTAIKLFLLTLSGKNGAIVKIHYPDKPKFFFNLEVVLP